MKITESNEDKIMYELIKKDGLAKRGRLHTVHGVIETPVFMNVGTAAAIKGAVSTDDLQTDQDAGGTFKYVSSPCTSGR